MPQVYKITVITIGSMAGLACIFILGLLVFRQQSLESNIALLVTACERESEERKRIQEQPMVVEKIVSSGQLWRPVQEKVRDTVIQVFAHISAIDLLKPYAPPAQGSATGSGFFINAEGFFVTNAHVVAQAESIWIQIPCLGKRIVDAALIGFSPDHDLALLRVTPEGLDIIQRELGEIPYLALGNSDLVFRADEVLALGYPLGQQMLKSTTGVVSGREYNRIQTSAAINPGNSGGPLVNVHGEVIGINSSIIANAQNVGYAIPVNVLHTILPNLYKVPLLRQPFLGVVFSSATESLVEYLDNPSPGGCYVVEVVPGSPLDKAGIERGDMIYSVNGFDVDRFGEMNVPWSEDKVGLSDMVNRLAIGDNVAIVVYRKGKRIEQLIEFNYASQPAIRRVYPGYEPIDYEIFGGMVVMELTTNHVEAFKDRAIGLAKYLEFRHQAEPVLIITHIFSNSQLYRSRILSQGIILNQVNGTKVCTLADFREAIKTGASSKFLTMLVSDTINRSSDNIFVVLPMQQLLAEEPQLAKAFRYPLTAMTTELTQEFLCLKKNSEPSLVVAQAVPISGT